MRPHAQLRMKLQEKVNKLEKHLEHFPADAVSLKVNLERHPKKSWFTASVTLKLPSGTLRAAKLNDDPLPAFDQAVKALLRELSSAKASLRHEKDWKAAGKAGGKAPLSVVATASSARAGRSSRASARG
jgi:ribosomal subunit interface protein